MVSLLRDVCEQEKLLVNMKIQYQFKYRKMFKNIYMYLPVQRVQVFICNYVGLTISQIVRANMRNGVKNGKTDG